MEPFKKINKKSNPELRRLCNFIKILIDSFYGREKILKLNENEKSIYQDLSEKWCSKFKISEKLSETDINLLISSRVLTETRGSCALISNDFEIFYLWKDIIRKENSLDNKWPFFCREGLDSFKKLYLLD